MNSQEIITKLKKHDGCMRTREGLKFNFLDPEPGMFEIKDIAAGLAYKCHFGGQTPYFFSIAQHSILVCEEFEKHNPDAESDMKLLALLHDASEAYTGDMIKPLKVLLPDFVKIENRIMDSIAVRFKLPIENIHLIKPYDLMIQSREYSAFYQEEEIEYMDPEEARKRFLIKFIELYLPF